MSSFHDCGRMLCTLPFPARLFKALVIIYSNTDILERTCALFQLDLVVWGKFFYLCELQFSHLYHVNIRRVMPVKPLAPCLRVGVNKC